LWYVLRTGCAWRQLPHDVPPWQTVYWYPQRWQNDGTWTRLLRVLRRRARQQVGRDPEPSAAIIDSQSIRTSPVRGTQRGYDGWKNIWGGIRHLLVDTLGWLLAVKVHADVSEQKGARQLLSPLVDRFPRLELIWADRGYHGHLSSWVTQPLGCRLVVREAPLPTAPPFPNPRWSWVDGVPKPTVVWPPRLTVHPKRWLVERAFVWLIRCRRLARDDEGLPRTSEAFICLAFLRLMLVRLTR
jgi:putative transposase